MQVIQGPQLLSHLIVGCTLIVFLLVGWHVVLDVRSCNSVPDNASEIDGFLRAHCPRAAAYAHTVACAVLQRASEHSVRRPPRVPLSADELLYFLLLQCKKHSTARKDERGLHRKRTGMCRVLATAAPALAALRLAHEHTRAEHARHARTTRARLASRAHALT